MGQQRLLATGVGGLQGTQRRGGVGSVDGVIKSQAGLAAQVGRLHYFFQQPGRLHGAHHRTVAGIYQIPTFPGLGGGHEGVVHHHRDVEVLQHAGAALGRDKGLYVRVAHGQQAHVGPPAGAPLLHRLGGHVEHLHKAHRPGADPLGGGHHVSRRAQVGEAEPGATAGLVDQGGLLHRLEDALQAVLHRDDKASAELAQLPARVHQGGAVGQKQTLAHEAQKGPAHGAHRRRAAVGLFALGHGPGHPFQHLFRGLDHPARGVARQIAALQNR